MNLGLFSESSLKEVSFVNFGDSFAKKPSFTDEVAADLEASDREDAEPKPASNTSAVWPFMHTARAVSTLKKAIHKRNGKRRRSRWTIKRQKRDLRCRINDSKDRKSTMKRRIIAAAAVAAAAAAATTTDATPASPFDRKLRNADRRNASDGTTSAGLPGYNFSFRQLHARLPGTGNVNEARDSSSVAYRAATGEDEARGKVTRGSSKTTETPADHSASRHAAPRMLIRDTDRAAKRDCASLAKRTDYYKNVARVNDDMGDIWEDTTSDSDENDKNDKYDDDDDDDDDDSEDDEDFEVDEDDKDDENDKDYNAVRITRRAHAKKTPNLANGNLSKRKVANLREESRRLPSRKKTLLRNLKDRSAVLKSGRMMRRRQKRRRLHNAAAIDDHDAPVLARHTRRESLARHAVSAPRSTDLAETSPRKRCGNYNNPRRRSCNSSTPYSCKENLKSTAIAILKDIRAQIGSTDNNRDTEDTEIAEDADESSDGRLDREVSMRYEWEDEDVPGHGDNSQISPAKSVPKVYANRKTRGRRQWHKAPIDCKYIDRMETTYQSVLPERTDLDESTPSSLKIKMDETNWDSGDCDISALIKPHSVEGRADEDDSAYDVLTTMPDQMVVLDDHGDGKSHQERNALMASACYVYREMPSNTDEETAVDAAKAPATRFRAKFTSPRGTTKDVITYGNRKKRDSNGNSSLADRSFSQEKSPDSAKVQAKSAADSNKDNDSDYENEKKYVLRRSTRSTINSSKELNNVGKLIWGSCSGWWPALIVEAEQVGMASEPNKVWVYWIGESQISLLSEKTQIEPFSRKLEERLTQKFLKIKTRSHAIDETIKMLRQRYECTLTKPYYYWIRRNISPEELDNLCFYPYPTKIQERLEALKTQNAKTTEKYILNQRNGSPEPKPEKKQLVEKAKDTKAVKQIEDERLPLSEQMPGVITWAKIPGHNWWPAMIIDYRDCCLKEPSFASQWIMWYGEYTVSQVHHLQFLKFYKGIEKMREYVENTKKHVYLVGVLQASKDYCSRLGCNTDNWSLDNVFKYFSDMNNMHIPHNHLQVSESNKVYDKYSNEIIKKINELKSNTKVDSERKDDISESDALRRVTLEQSKLEKLCLKCLKFPKNAMEDHPFFEGSLCKECSNLFKPCMFVFGNDDKCFYCTVCAATGTVVICDREDCPRVYCTACLKYLLCPKAYNEMFLEDPWECFLCRDKSTLPVGLLRPRADWKEKFLGMFRTTPNTVSNKINIVNNSGKKKGIRVLSLFDGLSTGLVVLLKLGITVDVYYASEIDQDALTISSAHFGDRITYLGDVRGVTKEKVKEIMPIDLLIGGSPCNDLSLVNPARLGLHNPKGTGILFFEYIRILKQLKKYNKGHHLFWLYENVASMPTEYRLEMNKHLGQEPMVVDSADFSPQHRLRLYWHNLPDDPYFPQFQKQQDVQDILTPNCNRYALVKKIRTVTTRTNSLRQGKAELKPIMMKGATDTLWITELEEIFGFPRHYTDVKNLSATNRQRLIGKSWSVQTLTAILGPLCSFFKCNEGENGQSDSQ